MIPTSLSDNVAYLIGDIQHRIYQHITQLFRENNINVTIEQFTVLSVLWYRDGLIQQELAGLLNRDKTTITRMINNMVKQNMVDKVPDYTDRRAFRIYLTHYGRLLQEKLMSVTGKIYMKVLEDLNENEIEWTIHILNKIKKNLKTQ